MWAFFAILSAFGQALGWALKKKTLNIPGINMMLGVVAYGIATACLAVVWVGAYGFGVPDITAMFVLVATLVSVLNVIAAWSGFKALERGSFSSVMPLMALTVLAIIPLEFALRGVLPEIAQVVGMVLIVGGVYLFGASTQSSGVSRREYIYVGTMLTCYAFAAPLMAVLVDESGDGLFSGVVVHFGITVGFLCLFLRGGDRLSSIYTHRHNWQTVILPMLFAGVIIAFLENGPVYLALETADASEVFSLKRTMPFFALILGSVLFHERITRLQVTGTFLLVAGSVCVVYFQ